MSKVYAKIVFNRESSVKECQDLISLLKENPLVSSIDVSLSHTKTPVKMEREIEPRNILH
jgi:hypothetical protein